MHNVITHGVIGKNIFFAKTLIMLKPFGSDEVYYMFFLIKFRNQTRLCLAVSIFKAYKGWPPPPPGYALVAGNLLS